MSFVIPDPAFRPGLPATRVHGALKATLDVWQRAEKCSVLWFAEIHRRKLFCDLGYSSIQQYAGESLGFSGSRIKQFLRLTEALERLPQLRRLVEQGRIGWTKARVVASIATPDNEARWIELAQTRNRAALEQKVAAVRIRARRMRAARSSSEPDQTALHLKTVEAAGNLPAAASATAGSASATPSAEHGTAAAPAATPGAPSGTPAPQGISTPPVDASSEDADLAVDLPITLTLRFSPLLYARYEALLEKVRKVSSRTGARAKCMKREELLLDGLEALLMELTRRLPAPGAHDAAGGTTAAAEASAAGAANAATAAGETTATATATAAAAASAAAAAGARSATRVAAAAARPDTRVSVAPHYQIVIYKCATCTRSEVRTTLGARRISSAATAAAACDARVIEQTAGDSRQSARSKASIPPAVRRAVISRDGHRCQSPGCGRVLFLEVHHLVTPEDGGSNRPENLITLCSACHQLAHSLRRRL